MLTHEKIWTAIDRFAASLGYSTSGLAKSAGLDPTTFNRSKRMGPDGKPRWPSTESISRILDATNSTMADFLSLIDAGTVGEKSQSMIPLLNIEQAINNVHFSDMGTPKGDGWEMMHFPHKQGEIQLTYALEIGTDITHPLFRSGEKLIISPTVATRRGDRVVVKITTGEILIKELVRQTASKIDLKSIDNNQENITYNTNHILWIARILWVSQ